MHLEPCTLSGPTVRLEPLSLAHHAALCEVGLDPEIWRWSTDPMETPEHFRKYIEDALRDRDAGTAVPFATVQQSSGRVVGTTRFANIVPVHRRVEIGWTFVAPPWQRTRINTEAKYLMLSHAFEVWGAIRVELKADALNEKSCRAIQRIGARPEGILRQHIITHTGRYRDTAYFSILDSEWPAVKARIKNSLGIA
jgi:RimJ/RimL family protein N-acetyltransferase